MIISIATQKGGTGKTTTSISLAACLARSGKRILLVDIDSQANSSKVLLPHYQQLSKDETIFSTVLERKPLQIHETDVPNLSIAPSHILLSNTDVELVNLRPDAIVAAWSQGAIDAAYIWTSVLMALENEGGKIIFTTGDLVDEGVLLIDGLVVRDQFKEENPDLVLIYLQEIARINEIYESDPQHMVDTMTDFMQIDRALVQRFVDGKHTLTPAEQASDDWMGMPGATDTGMLRALNRQAEFMVDTGQMTSAPDLRPYIDSSFIAQMI